MEKKRFKMYKKGKSWVVAPIIFLGMLGVGGLAVQEQTVQAAEVAVSEIEAAVVPQENTSEVAEVVPEVVVEDTSAGNSSEAQTPEVPVVETPTVDTPVQEDSQDQQEATDPTDQKEETIDSSTENTEEATTEESQDKADETTDKEGSEVVTEKEPDASESKDTTDSEKKPEVTDTVDSVTDSVKPEKAAAPVAQPKAAKAAAPKAAAPKAEATIPIYRVYNPNSGEHLHTMNGNEKDFLVNLGWRYEGISMRVVGTGRELYRIYNPNSGEHFYTLDGNERDHLKSVGWNYEGIAWHTPWEGLPMYRVYNPNTKGAGAHHYTMDANERDSLTRAGWRYEGVSWYTLGGAAPVAPVERVLSVPYVSQYVPVMSPWGCAGAAMAMLLNYKGQNVDLKYVQDNLPMYPGDPGGQQGNVYTGAGFGWVITPGSLTNYAKRWYNNVSNITGTKTQGIIDRIMGGNPVLYYGYSSYQKPNDTNRNHCKVVVGYKDNKFLVHDPLYYNANAKAGTGGGNMAYDRGAVAWVSVADFNREWDGRAVGIN
ncbi:C39 family peptidase [Enterococcus sp. 669A]|uniref:C39 family peptidase n=1 Tax=Candidatus Enterococcus moelleringii TaxID=2815325 RepID=A0ABS3LEI7_9ENTE|nr:C39 family peptidase [Enterococcus sp. 669A]MBO1308049.1 C39 family peptidase [Enterococcus sp. 669A]